MSTEVTLKVDNMNLADAMGFAVSSGAASGPSVPRLSLVQGAITKEIDDEERIIVPVGAYKLVNGDTTVYSKSVTVRLFAERQQWQKWDADEETMQKSLMATNLNADLKDTTGSFNLGRPSGYIQDWAALPESQKEVIRSVKRVKIYMGAVTLDKPIDENGNALDGYDTEIPFVFDVKNREAMKSIDGVVSKIIGKRISPVEYTLKLAGKKQKLPTGATYAEATAALGDRVGFSESDNEVLNDFLDYVSRSNEYVEGKWQENNTETISADDAALVGEFIEVKDFE